MIFDRDEPLAEIVRFFGKLPEEWWDRWEARADFFDEEGTWLPRGNDEEWSFEVALSKPTETFLPGADGKREAQKSLSNPKPEQELMADLLYKLFRYKPEKRTSAAEVLAHEWFSI